MKYTTVGQLRKMMKDLDDKTEIFFEAGDVTLHGTSYTKDKGIKVPKKLVADLSLDLHKPTFHDLSTDIDGSQTIWCSFSLKVKGQL